MRIPHQLIINDEYPVGVSKMWKIIINTKYKNNVSVFEHEYEHLKQWYVMVIVGLIISSTIGSWFYQVEGAMYGALLGLSPSFWLRRWVYSYYEPYRKWAEVQAFKKQILHSPSPHGDHFVNALVDNYRLNTTKEEIRALLYGT